MNSKNLTLTALILFFITLEVLISLDFVRQEEGIRQKQVAAFQAIIELQNQIGYVGLIHNFKNYILRPEEVSYRENGLKNVQAALKQVEVLEFLSADLLDELIMPATRNMLEAYQQRLEALPTMLEKNMSRREIDEVVRFNDAPSRHEIVTTAEKIAKEIEVNISEITYSSLRASLVTLFALFVTLFIMMRYYFRDQQKALSASKNLNLNLQENKKNFQRSQRILISVMKDVEKEKHEASRLNEQLSTKNKEMEQFIYTVSHDLKSPLVTIGSFAKNLMTELSEVINEKQQHRFNRIISNVENMEALLTDLLDLSKIVQQEITISEVNVKQVVDAQCLVLENDLEESNAIINVADNIVDINANERLLSEAILNLLSNAIRYRDPDRQLVVDIYSSESESCTTLHVKDNGVGIDAKYHELIFRIFERLSTHEGTGVGLTIVRTIMDKHHGKILLESSLGQGACFSLTFPNK